MKRLIAALLFVTCASAPAFAFSYPVSGSYGVSNETAPGPIDCTGKRVIRFEEERRFDNGGGVPDYRVIDLVHEDDDVAFKIREEFNTGQIRAQYQYLLRLIDSDGIEMTPVSGPALKLKRCL